MLVNVLLLFIKARDYYTKMIIVVNYRHGLTIEFPGGSVFVVVDVCFGASNHYLSLVSIKFQMIPLAIVANNVKSALEATDGVGDYVGVVGNTNCSDA